MAAFCFVGPIWGLVPRDAVGLVVESVTPGSAGAAAGLEPGDVLFSWSCAAVPPAFPKPASGSLQSPFDLQLPELEEGPRRAVILHGRRGTEEMAWTLQGSRWGVATRPRLSPDLAALYLEGQAGVESGDLASAERSWRLAAQSAPRDARLAGWLLYRLGEALAQAGKRAEAERVYAESLLTLEREPAARGASQVLQAWAATVEQRGAREEAVELFQKALALNRARAPKSLLVAATLDDLGATRGKMGHYSAAEELLLEALAIREELAPGTIEVAMSLNKLGVLNRLRGDLVKAEELLTRSEKLQIELEPQTIGHALLLLNLGNVARDRGDLERSETLLRQALAIFERDDPASAATAGCLQNLAHVMMTRGDLAGAEDLFNRSLALSGPTRGVMEVWRAWFGLGTLALIRNDSDEARARFRRSLELAEQISADGREVAFSLGALGELALAEGDFAAARTLLQRTQRIDESQAPESLDSAADLEALARLEVESGGDLATADELLRKALGIYEKGAPQSLESAVVLSRLGEVAARRGRLEEALALQRRGLDLKRRLAPDITADALHALGRTEVRAGQHEAGVRDLCLAIDALDRQRIKLGGTPEAKTTFEASLAEHYHACLQGRLELGTPAEAFHVLERGRARSLLDLLAQRDLRWSGLPPDLAAERRQANAEYDRVQAKLATLSPEDDGAEIELLHVALGDLRRRQEEVVTRMRRDAPRFAALTAPQPVDLAGARAALDAGTVLLAYAVGREQTWLFVVEPAGASGSGLSVFPIALGTQSLRETVTTFRLLLKDPGSDPAEIQTQGRRLYELLLRPAEAQIAKAQRILVSPDGPLHTLAFAALVRGEGYLVESKPVHSVLSATVYAELTRTRPPRHDPADLQLAAFGDPVYRPAAPDAPADSALREAVRRGLSLQPLPLSGDEVKAIAGLFPKAQVYLGSEATEERAKAVGPEANLLHFACHGLLDERFPLNSALALTLPEPTAEGRDNGLLQAWEIFESLRLEVELVTLSACDTALGKEMGGEGLVGLTRAFQFAGARSVLASLWGVADRSTARLMHGFYTHLRGGKPKDEALQAAQVDLIREKEILSHPFHWAAFQLTGDWR